MNWTDGRRKSLLSEIWLFIDLIQDHRTTQNTQHGMNLCGGVCVG